MTRSKPFTWIAAAMFALVALAHVARLFTNTQVTFGSHTVPMWVSYVGIAIGLLLSWMLCREARGARPGEA